MSAGGNSSERQDEAVAWYDRLNAGDADEKRWLEFTTWLEADPANAEAFDRVEDFHAQLGELRGKAATPALKPEDGAGFTAPRRPWREVAWVLPAGLAVAAGIAALIFAGDPGQMVLTTYATAIGERRTVSLSDGSRMDLNSGSRLTVNMDGDGRRVQLEGGEVLFQVTPDPARAFIVTAGGREIRVVGTIFNVLRHAAAVTVTVTEGRVAVSSGQARTELGSGDQFSARDGEANGTIRRVDPATAVTWREGYLTYDDALLGEIVSDLNRNFPGTIRLDDGSATRRFSGVLRMDSRAAVLDRLSQLLSLTVEERAAGEVVLREGPPRN